MNKTVPTGSDHSIEYFAFGMSSNTHFYIGRHRALTTKLIKGDSRFDLYVHARHFTCICIFNLLNLV